VEVGSMSLIRILNLYAGIGGNARHWRKVAKENGLNIIIDHVEINQDLCKELERLFPYDNVFNQDAHKYLEFLALENHLDKYDIIWSSPPCQTHSRMKRINSKKYHKSSYIDPSLYQQIILLKYNFNGIYFVENVKPYYGVIFDGIEIGRHVIWSNIDVNDIGFRYNKKLFDLSIEELQKEYGIKLSKNIYLEYPKGHDPKQVYRNAVHPTLGELIFRRAINRNTQATLFQVVL
jgi:DNA (cytosine-5)-methyltransferase 1